VIFLQEEILKMSDKDKFTAKIKLFPWLSYRSNFKEINQLTTDSGWGCMIRVGQMMIAYTILQTQLSEYKGTVVH